MMAHVEWTVVNQPRRLVQVETSNMSGRNPKHMLRRELEVGKHGMMGTKPLHLGDMVAMEIL